jgi:hypothetical protein
VRNVKPAVCTNRQDRRLPEVSLALPIRSQRSSGFGVFLKACSEPSVQRILLVDAPAVLGWQKWREMDAKYGLGLIRQALSAAVAMQIAGAARCRCARASPPG